MPNCKPGDIAIILSEEPGCANNIGRLVEVAGPLEEDANGRLSWLIQPLRPSLWMVGGEDCAYAQIVTWESQIVHPDEWMVPIHDFYSEGRMNECEAQPQPAQPVFEGAL